MNGPKQKIIHVHTRVLVQAESGDKRRSVSLMVSES